MHTGAPPSEAPDVRAIVRHIEELPAPPPVAAQILNTVMEDSADFSAVSQLIESDQSLTLQVLRMANSAAYGYRAKITSVEQAIATLGFDTLRTSLLSVIIRDTLYKDPKGGDPLLAHIWKHTLACAVAADLLAQHALPGRGAMAFAAGLIHDCGQLVLLAALPNAYEPLIDHAMLGGPALLAEEAEAVGVEHTQVGNWLLSQWKMPEQLVDAAWMHHQSPEALAELGDGGRLAAVIGLADILAHEVMLDARASSMEHRDGLAGLLGLGEDQLDAVKARIGEGYAKRAEAFNLDDQDAALFYFQALQRANTMLAGTNRTLARREARLARGNRMLDAVAAGAPALSLAPDAATVLREALRVVQKGVSPQRSFCYRLDAAGQALTGIHLQGTEAVPVRMELDDNLRPQPETASSALPEGLDSLLTTYLSRIPADDPDLSPLAERPAPRPMPAPPWLTLPLLTEDGFVGELCLIPAPGEPLAQELTLALAQLAGLAAAALHRLDMHERLEERADRLAVALRKIRRMNHKLLQTERLAAVGQLAAGAAHEINNPLAIIYARAQLLELKEEDPARKQSFQQMMAQIERITSILTNLMDFARPAPPRMDDISLNGVARRAFSLIQGELNKKHVETSVELAADLPNVPGDGNQLEQVLLNLLINAEHAVDETYPDGGGSITLRTEARPGKVLCSVTDNGVGIEAENLNKIFDPFFTTKEEGKGTGLGLSTSYGIIQNHGGDIRFRSRPGEGTEVTIILPMASEKSEVMAPSPIPQPRNAILVVDDEKHIRDILRESLEARGYTVETAADGEEGLQRLEAGVYRLLLLDIRMPSRDGLSLLAEAKKRVGALPVIVLTGMAGPDEIEQAHKLGAYKCVRKPFSIDALLADIAQAIEEGGSQ